MVLSEGLLGVRNIQKEECSWLLFCYYDSDASFGAAGVVRQFFEYSCAVTPQIRQTGNRLSGNAGTAYASLLA